MTGREQSHAVSRLLVRLDSVRLALRDRAAFGHELIEELERAASVLEAVADDARALAEQLDREEERVSLADDVAPVLSPRRDGRSDDAY